jgi:hypothetical protein
MPLDTRIHVGVKANHSVGLDLAAYTGAHSVDKTYTFTNGVGAGQADLVWSDTRTIAASATDSLDLAGSLTLLGSTVTFLRIKSITVIAADGNTNNVLVTRPATNGVPWLTAAGDQIIVRPGGYVSWGCGMADVTGIAVTASTGDLLDIVNSGAGTSVTYDITIVGCSA